MQDQVMALSRLKIPLFFAYDVVHGQRTVFPISLGLASSFNLDAVKTVGRVSAYEAADDGLNMTWAPMVSRAIRAGAAHRKASVKIRI
jgi:beta-glucosidase